jgi:hypothetical protein
MTDTTKHTNSQTPAGDPHLSSPKPDEQEARAMLEAANRLEARRSPFKAKAAKAADGSLTSIGPDHADAMGWSFRLRDTFGTASHDFAISSLNALIKNTAGKKGIDEVALNAALAVLDGVRPRDEIEGMLAAQMSVTHSLAMELLSRAKHAELVPQFESAGNMAVKLLRTYTAQAEALAKLRRGGEQMVRVEHVHVYPGGQAVVGNVNHRGGGGVHERSEQPHAADDPRALTFAPGPPLRCAYQEREAVPIAGSDRKETLSDARRRKG